MATIVLTLAGLLTLIGLLTLAGLLTLIGLLTLAGLLTLIGPRPAAATSTAALAGSASTAPPQCVARPCGRKGATGTSEIAQAAWTRALATQAGVEPGVDFALHDR